MVQGVKQSFELTIRHSNVAKSTLLSQKICRHSSRAQVSCTMRRHCEQSVCEQIGAMPRIQYASRRGAPQAALYSCTWEGTFSYPFLQCPYPTACHPNAFSEPRLWVLGEAEAKHFLNLQSWVIYHGSDRGAVQSHFIRIARACTRSKPSLSANMLNQNLELAQYCGECGYPNSYEAGSSLEHQNTPFNNHATASDPDDIGLPPYTQEAMSPYNQAVTHTHHPPARSTLTPLFLRTTARRR
jgi:hypothetical protein